MSFLTNVAGLTATQSIAWETASDWDNAVSESGVVHESVSNTDHTDAAIAKMGFSYENPANSPSALWTFDESSGDIIDQVGSSDLSVTGASYDSEGLLGTTALDTDGADDEMGGTVMPLADPTGEWTWLCYLNLESTSRQNIFQFLDDDTSEYISVGVAQTGEWKIFSDGRTGGTGTTVSTGWVLVGLTHDGSGEFELFLDATSDYTSSAGSTSWLSGLDNTNFAGTTQLQGFFTEARFDASWVFPTKLSASEQQDFYDVVNSPGSLTTATKEFGISQRPNLIADVNLNGVSSFDVDVIGSPSGTPETNTVSVDTDGENSYSVTWSNSHTDFRVKPKPDNGGDVTVTPEINKLELTA